MSQMDEWLAQGRMADGKPMTDGRLQEVFDLVKPVGNWKMPIGTLVRAGAATEEEITTAVIWYAGGVPEVRHNDDGTMYVFGAGYYEWVGA